MPDVPFPALLKSVQNDLRNAEAQAVAAMQLLSNPQGQCYTKDQSAARSVATALKFVRAALNRITPRKILP